ncbi:class I SAM-dependent DNA methyltransferase [Priestia endophytica]|uniref:class I SAM-dependent DNA methyltransferase n=1 Tax=Priestia endophytica TaxID=135735 RepID=UPI002E1EBECF|nr:methyltransferase domain-containing protein [Priestia endophytica]
MKENYFGVFKKLKQMQLPTEEMDLYEGFFVDFYDQSTAETTYDLDFYLKYAKEANGTILELACGTGRVSLVLAEHGYDVLGIDTSQHMLELLKKKKKKKVYVDGNIYTRLEDMVTFKLDEKFNLAILPATSICLLPNDDVLLQFLDNLYEHMNVKGKFIFDYSISDISSKHPREEKPMQLFTSEEKEHKQFVLFSEQYDYKNEVINVNFYGELIDEENITHRKFGTTMKRLLTDEIISNVIKKSKFKVSHTHVIRGNEVPVRFVVLEK